MVYCTKCGTKNEDDATVCKECKASLQLSGRQRRPSTDQGCFGPREHRGRDECFNLPYGGAIVGIIFGLLIICAGLAILVGLTQVWGYLWPLVIVIFGVLLIAGVLYGLRR